MALSWMAHLWLSVKVVSGCTVLFGSRTINCSQEETLGNLLSRLEEDKFLESGWPCSLFFLCFVTGHPRLFCDRASSSNKILSRSWPFCSAPVWLLLCSANAKPQYCVVNSLDQWNYSKILPDSLAALCRKQNSHVIQQELMNRHGGKERPVN